MRRWSISLMLTLILGAGFESRAGDYSSDYLFFFPFVESTKAWACDMDSSGTISFREEFQVGYDSLSCKASPNGQLVVISSVLSPPKLSCFFIDRGRNISPPIYNNERMISQDMRDKIIFHPYKPLIYVGTHPHTDLFDVDYANKTIKKSNYQGIIRPPNSDNVSFSKWANGIVFPQSDYTSETIGVGFVKISEDGEFTTHTTRIDLGGSRFAAIRSLDVSPNGRFIAVLVRGSEVMHVMEIGRDGEMQLLYSFDNKNAGAINGTYIKYSPDGAHLILTCTGNTNGSIFTFIVDPITGIHSRGQIYAWPDVPYFNYCFDLTFTPDGKYMIITDGISNKLYYYLFSINHEGTLTCLKDKLIFHYPPNAWPSRMDFVPPWRETVAPPHGFILH